MVSHGDRKITYVPKIDRFIFRVLRHLHFYCEENISYYSTYRRILNTFAHFNKTLQSFNPLGYSCLNTGVLNNLIAKMFFLNIIWFAYASVWLYSRIFIILQMIAMVVKIFFINFEYFFGGINTFLINYSKKMIWTHFMNNLYLSVALCS